MSDGQVATLPNVEADEGDYFPLRFMAPSGARDEAIIKSWLKSKELLDPNGEYAKMEDNPNLLSEFKGNFLGTILTMKGEELVFQMFIYGY